MFWGILELCFVRFFHMYFAAFISWCIFHLHYIILLINYIYIYIYLVVWQILFNIFHTFLKNKRFFNKNIQDLNLYKLKKKKKTIYCTIIYRYCESIQMSFISSKKMSSVSLISKFITYLYGSLNDILLWCLMLVVWIIPFLPSLSTYQKNKKINLNIEYLILS